MDKAFALVITYFVLVFWAIGSWLTHIIFCLKSAQYVLLVAGAIVAPVGMIHGTGLWFGAW